MTEATTGTNAQKAKRPVSPFDLSNAEMPKFDLPKMEVPAALREIADKGLTQAKEYFESTQAAGNEVTDSLVASYSTAAKGVADFNLKLLQMARLNTSAVFDFAFKTLSAKSPSEVIELLTVHAREQFDTASAQSKELLALAQQVATETSEPIKQGVIKTFSKVARS